jgi:transposase
MFYCGIDLASKTTALCVVDEKDHVALEIDVATDPGLIGRRLKRFGQVLCLVEAAPLAEWCQRELQAQAIEVEIIDTRKAKGLFDARKKTDRRDARTLARMARAQWYSVVHAKSEAGRLLRTRLQARQGLVSTRVAMQNRIKGLLRAQGIRFTGAAGARFAQAIRERLAGQAALQGIVEPLLKVWEAVGEQLRAEDKALHRLAREKPEVRRLHKVPGVGALTALAFVATIDEPRRFSNERQVGDYVGLAPGIYQSGETERLGRITRQGDKMLRALLVEAANSVLYHCRTPWVWKRWVEELSARKGSAKAKVALARRLAGLLWRLWRDETDFVLRVA